MLWTRRKMPDIYGQISRNKWKSVFMIFLFVAIVAGIGWVFGQVTVWGNLGVVFAVVIAVLLTLVQYYHGDKMILKISKARPAKKPQDAYIINTVEGLSIAAGIPKPKVYIIEDPAPNAFATGRDPQHSSVAFTTGIIKMMNRQELEGVAAHELSHIKNYDIRLATIVVALVGVVTLLANWMLRSFFWGGTRDRKSGGNAGAILMLIGIVLAILSPFFATLVQLAISRKREYLADASGAMMTRYPEGLASALEKLEKNYKPMKTYNKATAPLYISSPKKKKHLFKNLMSTHPPLGERITRLRGM
jgi:heat shock protein HtpX